MRIARLRLLSFLFLLVGLAFVGCQDGSESQALVGPNLDSELLSGEERAGPGELSVVTWNVYYGADLNVLLEDSAVPLPGRVAQVFGQVQATNAPERAAAMAKLLASSPPDVIGLQEVARYSTQSPGDFLDASGNVQNPFPNAADVVFDFVALLQDALLAEGLEYVEASRTTTFDVELPMFTGGPCPPCDDLRLTESVAVLARSGLPMTNPDGGTFAINLPVSVEGFALEIVKGWASIDVTVKDLVYRFVTTHLESADIGPGGVIIPEVEAIQLAQAAELVAILDGAGVPLIVGGDLNTEPDGGSTGTYEFFMGEGFIDTWRVGPPRGDGFTANQDADLQNEVSQHFHRIDHVFYRDDSTSGNDGFKGAVHAELLGEATGDRTASSLWPSDHAGVSADLKMPPGVGLR